jgi:putative heme iron utilization protein
MTHPESSPTIYEPFLDSFRSLILGTVDEAGFPETSYAPYLRDAQKNFYILASDLATHTTNLLTHPKASILFIEDEDKSPQIFGRRRLSFSCHVQEIDRSDRTWETTIAQLQEIHGERVALIASLPDFHLFKLTPFRGRFVQGFGGIYDLSGDGMAQARAFQPKS